MKYIAIMSYNTLEEFEGDTKTLKTLGTTSLAPTDVSMCIPFDIVLLTSLQSEDPSKILKINTKSLCVIEINNKKYDIKVYFPSGRSWELAYELSVIQPNILKNWSRDGGITLSEDALDFIVDALVITNRDEINVVKENLKSMLSFKVS